MPITAIFYYPNVAVSTLEHIVVGNWGAYASNFSPAITPCDNCVTEVGQLAINSRFAEVVEESAITLSNTNGASDFDNTQAVFDPAVVHEYIDIIGARGGAFVTSFNESSRSDLRRYVIDSNRNMLELYAQREDFKALA
ncbi:uncharacterized protein F4812DRAFT_458743 [Daldinia caldariorum]|uniref:uncharacterized protein n=1 Tax=Daldinia caldariorum TaxID=326644 RepID=UPI002007E2C0|nr:uncharacterized protein F4812DRAFT_458743 [Daldinia caldariorum]KAI1468310.1 hypothetical protein F4812DRAFT_458743 [Daldinia caldariorum]